VYRTLSVYMKKSTNRYAQISLEGDAMFANFDPEMGVVGTIHQFVDATIILKLIEGTRYLRRIAQPSPHLTRSNEVVDCLICRLPSDSENEEGRTTLRRRHVKDDIRQDKFSQHFKA